MKRNSLAGAYGTAGGQDNPLSLGLPLIPPFRLRTRADDRREHCGVVLFVDVCTCGPGVIDTGAWMALDVIGRTLDTHAPIVKSSHGQVVRSTGDDLLCTFKEPGDAARATQSMLFASREAAVPIRIGVHFGTYISAHGDVYGDTVNIAARLKQLATDNEALVSDAFRERLNYRVREDLIPFDHQRLRGCAEATRLFRIVPPGDNTTGMHLDEADDETTVARIPLEVRIGVGNSHYVLDAHRSQLAIGRREGADIKLSHSRISRAHAKIVVRDGSAELIDSSTHGTWLTVQGQDVLVRRERMRLIGHGAIGFGDRPASGLHLPVTFAVTRKLVSC